MNSSPNKVKLHRLIAVAFWRRRINSIIKNILKTFPPWSAAVLSGLLMAAAFTPWNYSILAWIAWIPLLSQIFPISSLEARIRPSQLGFVVGLIFWLLTIYWLAHVTIAGMIALAAYLALYLSIWTSLMIHIQRLSLKAGPKPQGWIHILLAFIGASAWVGLEWIRGWALGGFPWNFAGVSQYQNLALIQIAGWTGVYGVSFVIIFFNLCLWLAWRRMRIEHFSSNSWRYELSVAILLITFCLSVGTKSLLKTSNTFTDGNNSPSLKLALIQPNIPQDVKYEPLSRNDQQQRLASLSRATAAAQPDLILWPETALVDSPFPHSLSRSWLQKLAYEIHTPIFFGTLDTSLEESIKSGKAKQKINYYNAAMLIKPDGIFAPPYHKLHLVPFGEYIPFESWIPGLRWLTPSSVGFKEGNHFTLFDFKDLKLGALICFEDTFPHLAGAMSKSGADILVNLTNDAWFKNSPGAAMHAANATFRAIETRRPLIRCTNNGMSMIVAPNGKIVSSIKPFSMGFQIIPFTPEGNKSLTVFTRYGDWFPILCLAITLIGWMFLRYLPVSPYK